MNFDIRQADLSNAEDQHDILRLLDHYARQPTGQGRPLDAVVRRRLIDGLQRHPGTMILLGQVDRRTVALACCFLGFSTFRARPILNIHDLVVEQGQRGKGLGEQMLRAVIDRAARLGCAAVTLEVRGDNPAQRLYQRVGFRFTEGPHLVPVYFGRYELPPESANHPSTDQKG
ncbi:MAG: N-acetyltransferase [Pirellulaceae bacterium]|nr:MAG: N-acetyltransferase [Pirellulaceae bacterium]